MVSRRKFLSRGVIPLAASILSPFEAFAPLGTRADDNSLDRFGELLNVLRERTRLPAVAAVIADRNQILAQAVAGRERVDRTDAVPTTAHWQLGSITKTFGLDTLSLRAID